MNAVDLIIKNGIIVCMDSQWRIIENGSIAIKKDKIIDIGLAGEIDKKYIAGEYIDATRMLVMPGLINGHTHAAGSLYRGLDDNFNLEQAEMVYDRFDDAAVGYPHDFYIGTLLSCLGYIKTGSTCIVNQDWQSPEVARAVEQAGIRGVLAPFMVDTWRTGTASPNRVKDREQIIADATDFVRVWNGKADGRIRCYFGPMHEIGTSKELLTDIVALAEQYKTGIHIHLAETLAQVDAMRRIYGKRSIEYAFDLGLLRPGTIVAHGCWLSPREISLLAESGASVAHAPVCEMKFADGITPVPHLLQAGVNVTLGTDGAGIDNGSNDLIREMKTATLLHKVSYPLDPESLTAEKALEMATINGAKAVMWDDEIGSLEKGKKADIILIDLAKPHFTPLLRKPKFNIINLLVYGAVGDDVDTMIVNGKTIMLHRKVLTLDEDKTLREAQSAAEAMIARSGVEKETFYRKR